MHELSRDGLELLDPSSGERMLRVSAASGTTLARGQQSALYTILLMERGEGTCHVDAGRYALTAPAVLFATPFQVVRVDVPKKLRATQIQFHGDFYCIELHKEEVACNGLLFNNCYEAPLIAPAPADHAELARISFDLQRELAAVSPSSAVLTAYLQLFLARASQIKRQRLADRLLGPPRDAVMDRFRALIAQHARDNLKPKDYAARLNLTGGAFTRRCKRVYGKTPSALIQEQTILEAKKLLHLTRAPIKEIASTLGFADEHYFSRYFKKLTRVSPKHFRERTGISVVADQSR